jgi:hypothetical protein
VGWAVTVVPVFYPARLHLGDEMTLDEFRVGMVSYRRSADDEAKSLKDPQVTLEKLRALYREFDDVERHKADQVLCEWALSEDEGVRFDALALIDKLKVDAAVPALHELAARLGSSPEPSAPYELEKIHRIVVGLGALANSK